MKYEFKEVKDLSNWDDFVLNFKKTSLGVSQTTFIQLSAWKDFQENMGRQVLCFKGFINGQVVAAGIGVVIKAKRGKYLYFRNGPILDWSQKDLVEECIDYLKAEAKKLGLWFVRFSPLVEIDSIGHKNINDLKLPLAPMNDVEALDTYLVDLRGKNQEALMAEIKKKVRYEIRKSQKELSFESYSDDSKLDEFYNILKDTVARNNWTAYSKEYIRNELNTYARQNQASLILAKYNKEYIAGAIFIHDSIQSYYHYAASSSEHRELSAAYGIIWSAMCEALKRKHEFFNFWGITPENAKSTHPWSGLTSFKMKFPGFVQRWCPSHDIPTSPLYFFTNTYERIDKSRKGY